MSIKLTSDGQLYRDGALLVDFLSVADHIIDEDNPHNTDKSDVGLSNVLNVEQLEKSQNLGDIPDAAQARTNIGAAASSHTHSSDEVTYDNSTSGLSATDVKEALDELATEGAGDIPYDLLDGVDGAIDSQLVLYRGLSPRDYRWLEGKAVLGTAGSENLNIIVHRNSDPVAIIQVASGSTTSTSSGFPLDFAPDDQVKLTANATTDAENLDYYLKGILITPSGGGTPPSTVPDKIFWGNPNGSGSVLSADLDGTNQGDSGGYIGSMIYLTYDYENQKVILFDSDDNGIKSMNPDFTGLTTLFTRASTERIRLIGSFLYFTEQPGSIYRSDLDGTNEVELVNDSSLTQINGYDVSVTEGKLFYISDSPQIKTADFDGSNQTVIFTGTGSLYDLVVDDTNDKVFAVGDLNGFQAGVVSFNLDGSSPTQLLDLSGQSGVPDVIVQDPDNNRLYFGAPGYWGYVDTDGTNDTVITNVGGVPDLRDITLADIT